MKLVFWLYDISMHFSAVIRALSDLGHQVSVVAEEELRSRRRSMGWFVPDLGNVTLIFATDDDQIESIVRESGPDAIHIMSSIRGKTEAVLTRICRRDNRRLGVYIEAPHPQGVKLPVKWMLYTMQRFTRGRAIDFIFPLGNLSVQWYRHCGYSSNRLFPCIYVPDYVFEPVCPEDQEHADGKCRILFVGQCAAMKRVDLLLKALAFHRTERWTCTIVGDGPMKANWQKLADRLGFVERTAFFSFMPYADVMRVVRKHDLLVLPSSRDGWGVVVNEALMNGVPVICSDSCGAADLLSESWRGGVFRSKNVESLAQLLDPWIVRGATSFPLRQKIQTWAQCISSTSLAQYIISVLQHVYADAPRPAPPWRNNDGL